MAGIKFRRNLKSLLTDILEAEVVYATDTEEWGLGLNDLTVSWRKHELIFKNVYLKGDGIPSEDLGDIGNYYFDLENQIVYQKEEAGWFEIDYPISQTVIDADFLGKGDLIGFNDFSGVVKKDGSVKAPDGYEAQDPLEVATKAQAVSELLVLQDDGTTQMQDGYVGIDDGVVVKIQDHVYAPPILPGASGTLWNDNGVPKIVPYWFRQTKFFAPNGTADDLFGISVDLDTPSNRLVVGAQSADGGGINRGQVYLYYMDQPTTNVTTISDPSGDNYGYFGRDVSISGDYLAVAKGGSDTVLGSGYVFRISTGQLLATLSHVDNILQDGFGSSIANGDAYTVVGCPKYDGTNPDTGAVYVYGIGGGFIRKLIAPDEFSNEKFGSSVAVSSDGVIIVSAPDDMTGGDWSGSVYLFNGSDGAFIDRLSPFDKVAGDRFGWSLDTDGDNIIIGALGVGTNNEGAAYIYKTDGTFVRKIVNPNAFDNEHFGTSVSISGNLCVITNDPPTLNGERAYIFELGGKYVTKIAVPNGESSQDAFQKVKISGDYLVYNSVYDDELVNNAGAVYLVEK